MPLTPSTKKRLATLLLLWVCTTSFAAPYNKKHEEVNEPLSAEHVKLLANEIDQCIERELKTQKLTMNKRTSDGIFFRRAFLDGAGRIPTLDEAKEFFADNSSNKRAKLIDRLMDSPGYNMHQFNWLADMLRVEDSFDKGGRNAGLAYQDWLKDRIADRTPWDKLVAQMVSANGKVCDNGATGFLLRDIGMPLDGMSNLMTVFLGANVGCAQCHDHPFAQWSQSDFYKMAAFFSATNTRDGRAAKKVGKKLKKDSDEEFTIPLPVAREIIQANILQVKDANKGNLHFPDNYKYDDAKPGSKVEPEFLSWGITDESAAAYAVDVNKPAEWRNTFARWLTSPNNPRFAVNIANRVWKKYFGQAVQEPMGDLDNLEQVSHPELLALLTNVVKEVHFDLRQYERVLMNTKAYQAEAFVKPLASNKKQVAYVFQGPLLRRMSAEQAWDSIVLLAVGGDADNIHGQRGKVMSLSSIPENDFSDENIEAVAQKLADAGFFPGLLGDMKTVKKETGGQKKGDKKMMENAESGTGNYVGGRPQAFGGGGLLVRASELPQPAPETHFLRVFGQSDRLISNTSATDGSVPQILALMNGPVTHIITDKKSAVLKTLVELKDPALQARYVWIAFYTREPSRDELNAALEALRRGSKVEDLAWALLNSHEFLFIQ